MKIGVVGAGSVGTAIAKRLVPQGHEVMLSYSRDPAKLEGAAEAFGAIEALPSTVVDVGPLESARYVEPAGFLLVRLAYGLGFGSRIGIDLLTTEVKAAR